jgi:hypothetical protein
LAPFLHLSSHALLTLLLVALAGRVVLSCLPPGAPGSHAPRALAATWAASHALGALCLGLALGAAAGLGLGHAWVLAPLLLASVGRIATLPGAMVPRHTVAHGRAHAPALALRAVLVLALAVPWLRATRAPDHFGFVNAANLTAIATLVGFGLERARRAPAGRALVLLALCAAPYLQALAASRTDDLLPALLCAAGCAGTAGWLRCADRRGAALAALAFAGLFAWGFAGAPLALAGLFGLVLFTPPPGRRRVTPWVLAAVPAVLLGALLGAAPSAGTARGWTWSLAGLPGALLELGRAAADWGHWHVAWIAALVALVLGVVRAVGVPADLPPRAIAPPQRELAALVFVFALALAAHAVVAACSVPRDPGSGVRVLVFLAPCAAMIAGLVLVPEERP